MTFRELYMLVLDKLDTPEGDRRTEELVKTFINTAYIYVSRFDHGVIEMESEMTDESSIVYLPDNFLSMKKVVHPKKGILTKDDYRIINNRLILAEHIERKGELKLTMALVPDRLVKDDDVPEINEKYHIYLVYYALFLFTDDDKWYQVFLGGTSDLLDKEEDLDGLLDMDMVVDKYYGSDVR